MDILVNIFRNRPSIRRPFLASDSISFSTDSEQQSGDSPFLFERGSLPTALARLVRTDVHLYHGLPGRVLCDTSASLSVGAEEVTVLTGIVGAVVHFVRGRTALLTVQGANEAP